MRPAQHQCAGAGSRRAHDHVIGDDHPHGRAHESRYAFPTLLFRGPGGEHTVPGWMPYEAYVEAMEAAVPGSTSDARPDPSPSQALQRWGALTERELAVLCGPTAEPPADAVAHDWGGGTVWFTHEEATARGLRNVSPAGAASLRGLRHAFELAERVLAAISPEQWQRPTPCEEWDVRALVNHMVGGARMVTYGLQGRDIGPGFYGNHLSDDPVQSYHDATAEALDAFRTDPTVLDRVIPVAWGEVTGARLADLFMGDHVVHAWDAAVATGQSTDFDAALVARAEALSRDYVGDVRRGPEMFGPERTAPAGANAMDRLAAYLGRTVTPQH